MDATHGSSTPGRVAIERWWPRLSIAARHRVLEDLEAELDDETAAEIESLTGEQAPDRLTPGERAYIRTQIEAVD
ncbi:hypothetical protein [Agromyces sp. Marseille-P2726]|uniref:hypothetical protein n=1 Tax=Agromyces sp. Marseille-P2726 TaxID=2709132 RepID=UPI00156EB745|nr:hypothetical protein [Agromyces sp. Marseille-P2726]